MLPNSSLERTRDAYNAGVRAAQLIRPSGHA